MFVPIIPNINVINKNIVYTDTILNLREMGSNLKVTSIDKINEHSIEECLRIIFKSNPNVVFNTIQYSKRNNKLYFYTDKDISTKEWKEKQITIHQPVSNNKAISEELKKIFEQSPNDDKEVVSLSLVLKLMKIKNRELKDIENEYKNKFDEQIRDYFGDSSLIVMHRFDYKLQELEVSFRRYSSSSFGNINFKKEDGDLYISKSSSPYAKEVLVVLGNKLSKLYDEYMKYEKIKTQFCYKIPTINSSSSTDISSYEVSVRILNSNYLDKCKITAYSYEDSYEIDCNSSIVINAIKGNEEELFKRLYVNILNCPEWSRDILYQMREAQLEKNRIDEEKMYEEINKPKQKSLIRRFLFWRR